MQRTPLHKSIIWLLGCLLCASCLGMCAPPPPKEEHGFPEQKQRERDTSSDVRDANSDARQDTSPTNAEPDGTSEPSIDVSDTKEALVDLPSEEPPIPPKGLTFYITGNPKDARVQPKGPGLILMGGSREVDAAFQWWKPRVNGGDVVVIRASGSDGYNAYLYDDIGGIDSVVTLLVTSRALAQDPYVLWHLRRAEGIFIAGGDQGKYVKYWRNTPLAQALQNAYTRGAVLGGTSAGLAVLGQFTYDALQGSIRSSEALADPYDKRISLTRDFLTFPLLKGWLTDSHFAQRDRMGRLIAFVSRLQREGWSTTPIGIGVDERTALVVNDKGIGTVMGQHNAYIIKPNAPPVQCTPGKPLITNDIALYRLSKGDTIQLPIGTTKAQKRTLATNNGKITPENPYQ